MCIHPRVQEEGDRDTVDGICRKMTASWVRANDTDGFGLCNFYESYSRDGSNAGNYCIQPFRASQLAIHPLR